jgi:hypothetical protein
VDGPDLVDVVESRADLGLWDVAPQHRLDPGGGLSLDSCLRGTRGEEVEGVSQRLDDATGVVPPRFGVDLQGEVVRLSVVGRRGIEVGDRRGDCLLRRGCRRVGRLDRRGIGLRLHRLCVRLCLGRCRLTVRWFGLGVRWLDSGLCRIGVGVRHWFRLGLGVHQFGVCRVCLGVHWFSPGLCRLGVSGAGLTLGLGVRGRRLGLGRFLLAEQVVEADLLFLVVLAELDVFEFVLYLV